MISQETPAATAPREDSGSDSGSRLARARQLTESGAFEEAAEICDQLLQHQGDNLDALNLLGVIRIEQGQPQEALAVLETALRLDPANATVLNHAGEALMALQRFDDALSFFRQAREADPDDSRALRNIGAANAELGRTDLALASFAEAARSAPEDPLNWRSLGDSLRRLGRLEEALRCFDKCVEIAPGWGDGHHGRGLTLADSGRVDDAVDALRRAVKAEPPCLPAEADLLLYSCKSDTVDTAEVQRAHRRWAERHHRSGPAITTGADRNPHRRLRIGYLAPAFDDPAWAPLIKPVIAAHDRTEVEVFCYASTIPGAAPDDEADRPPPPRPPRGARRLTGLHGVTDEDAARQMAVDRIDVLVDLAGHLPGGRAALFAWRPAPVQLGWARYPLPVGLSAISNRLTDRVLDPEVTANPVGDPSIRLPGGAFCWQRDSSQRTGRVLESEPGPPPAEQAGYVTFGCRADIAHISVQTAANWAAILRRVSGSRLSIETAAAADESAKRQLADRFALHGIEAERLVIAPPASGAPDEDAPGFWEAVDIGLDTQPWNGLEETCAALWHGVPVLTVRGETPAGRVGASLLIHAGFSDLVAETRGRMVEAAIALARDLPRLRELRQSLRTTLLASPLGNAGRMARELETTYRRLWRHWCQAGTGRVAPDNGAATPPDLEREPAEEDATAPSPRLVLGGDSLVPGWKVVSTREGEGLIVTPRLTALKMFDDGSVGDVYLPDVPETLPGRQSVDHLLAEAARVLSPGGRLRLSVPDKEAIDALLAGSAPDQAEDTSGNKVPEAQAEADAESSTAAEIVRSLLGEGEEKSAAFSWDDIRQRLSEAGFRRIARQSMFPDFPAESSRRVDGRPMILNVEAVRTASGPEA